MSQSQKGFSLLLLLAAILVIVAVGLFLFARKGTNILPIGQNVSTIQNRNDLDAAAKDLDNTDPSQVDSQLNQLNTDASGF